VVASRDYLIERYLKALSIEIGWLGRPYEIDTLFVGGGTPSHLNSRQLEELFWILRRSFTLSAGAEFSVECNPADLDRDRCCVMRSAGVNRVSLGAQSLSPPKLHMLQREHSPDDVRRAVSAAQTFASSVSVDLIFAAPGESLAAWLDDLEQAMAMGPQHVSAYELTFEKGTTFWNRLKRGDLSANSEEITAAMYCQAIEQLESAGWKQYEVSNFARTGYRCRHNEVYWTGQPFFGFGPGAARFVDGFRETNHHSSTEYLKRVEASRSPISMSEKLKAREAAAERLILGLRRIDGIDEQSFVFQTGERVEDVLGPLLPMLLENDLLRRDENSCRLTRRGILFSDEIASKILARLD
jgi:oxygen-independent coproporphyrinogen-3 oxidase